MSDWSRLLDEVAELEVPATLRGRVFAGAPAGPPPRRHRRVRHTALIAAAAVAIACVIAALALVAHSREQKAKPAKSTIPAHIVLDTATSQCKLGPGYQHVWVIVGLLNTGGVDGEVVVLPWRRLSNDIIGYPGNVWDKNPTPASRTVTVKVPAHTMKKVKIGFGFATEGKRVHLKRCGVILGDDLKDLEDYGSQDIHFLRITPH